MQSGLIHKVAISPANWPDAQGLHHVWPTQGAINGDKDYGMTPARQAAAQRGCHLSAIQRNNMNTKTETVIAGIPICGRHMSASVRSA